MTAGAFVVLGLAAAGLIIPLNTLVGIEVGCAFVLVLAKFFEQALLVRREDADRPAAATGAGAR